MRSGRLFPNLFPDRALRQGRVRDLALAALAGVSLLWVALPAWAQMACGSQSILDLVPAIEDADGDYVGDGSDNCVGVFNPHQIDADADGYGNACDGDLNNDGAVGMDDVGLMFAALQSADPVADLNSDDGVGMDDVGDLLIMLGDEPGPSGLECAGPGAVSCTAF